MHTDIIGKQKTASEFYVLKADELAGIVGGDVKNAYQLTGLPAALALTAGAIGIAAGYGVSNNIVNDAGAHVGRTFEFNNGIQVDYQAYDGIWLYVPTSER